MPATLIATAILGAAAAGTVAYAAIVFGVRLITTYVISRIMISRANSRNDSARQDTGVRLQLAPATNNKLPIVYGTAWLKPVITDAKISTDQKTMWYVCAYSEVPDNATDPVTGTPINMSFGTLRWGDKTLNFDGSDPTKVISWTNQAGETDTRVNGLITVYRYVNGSNTPQTGTSQTAIQVLQDSAIAAANRWTSTDLMSRTAFLVVKVQYNQEIGLTGLGEIQAQLTNSLSNPGGVLYDYFTNNRYGCAVAAGNVNTASLANLSAYAAQTISYTPAGGGSATIARYAINGPLDTGNDCFQNLQIVADACDSWIQFNEALGQWGIVINKAYDQAAGSQPAQTLSELFSVNDNNIIGGIEFNPVDLNSTYNRVEVSYPDTNIYDSAGYAYVNLSAEDRNYNEPDNLLSFTLPVTNNNVTAKYIATRRLIQSREDLIVQVTTDFSGIQIDAGDLVRVTNSKFGWTDKVFRVTQVQEAKDDTGFLGATLVLSEYNAQVYGNIDITQFVPSPNTGITDPTIATTPAAPTITNILNPAAVPSFQLNATVPTQGSYGAIEFYYSDGSDTLADYVLLKTLLPTNGNSFAPGSIEGFTVTGLIQDNYYFRVRMVTVTGSKSAYSPAGPSNLSVPYAWNPSVTAPGQEAISLEWSPLTIVVPSANDGSNAVTGQTAALRLYVGTAVANLWDGSNTQPSNTWYANSTVITTAGITANNLTFDTGNNVVRTTLTGITANTDTGTITVANITYKDSSGNVNPVGTTQIAVTKLRAGNTGNTGNSGTQYNTAYLYQWSPTQPGNTSGQSTFDWTTGINSGYTGGNNWSVTAPANPGTSGIRFWTASKSISAPGGSNTSIVDWTSNVNIFTGSQNGLNGSKTALAIVYQWGLPPAPTISGTSTYTWSTGAISGVPSGWSQTPGSPPSGGYNLYAAEVTVEDASTATTSTINWTTARVYVTGYAGNNGSAAQLVKLTSDAQIFSYDGQGNASPAGQIITFEAQLQNIPGIPTFAAFAEPGNVNITSNLAVVNSTTRTLNIANFGGYLSATISATAANLSDQITVVRVSDGANGAAGNAVTGYLTNESITFAASSNGNIPSYAGGSGSFEVYRNLTRTNGLNTTFSVANTSNCNISINTTTGAYTVTGMSDSVNIASANLQVIYTGDTPSVTLTKTLSLAKSIAGANGSNGSNGVNGTRTAILDMYQWNAAVPTAFPQGTSTYTWANGQFTAPATTNGWNLTPTGGSAGQNLHLVRQVYADSGNSSTSTVTWTATSSSIIGAYGANGQNGTRTAVLELYQWSASSPAALPSGNSTYTWSDGSFTAPGTPNGWTLTPGAVVAGSTLWGVKKVYADTGTSATSTVNWSGATGPYPVGAAGTAGTPGLTSRIAYARFGTTILNPTSGTISTTGPNSLPSQTQSNSVWTLNTPWSDTDPNPSSANTLWIADGIYNGTSNTTTWNTPYIASLRVGQLSAITVNTGNLNVDGFITMSNLGAMRGGKTNYASTTDGFFLGYDTNDYKFNIGDANQSFKWDGTQISLTGNIVGNANINITGSARFEGVTTFGSTSAALLGYANTAVTASGKVAVYGIQYRSPPNMGGDVPAVYGYVPNSGDTGVYGENTSTVGGVGVQGESFYGKGAYFSTRSATYGGLNDWALVAAGDTFSAGVGARAIRALGTVDMSRACQLNWLTTTSANPTNANIGAYITTDSNDALYIMSGKAGSADPKAILFGTKGVSRARVEQDYLRPEVDNAMYLGAPNFRFIDVYATSGFVNPSDEREKILGNVYLGLNFIRDLEPISYRWINAQNVIVETPDGERYEPREGVRYHQGLSAQQVKATMDKHGLSSQDFAGWLLSDPDNADSAQSLRYGEFIAPLINAVKELTQRVEQLEAEVKALRSAP